MEDSNIDHINVETFYPENPLLRQHIEYYYFLKTDAPDFKTAYYAFPNTLQSFNIHKNASCTIADQAVTVRGGAGANNLIILQGKYELPMLVKLEGQLDKITINFKPLGLNPFLTSSLSEAAPHFSQIFIQWQTDKRYAVFIEAFYATPDNAERVRLLENYLLSRYQPLKENDLLQKSLDLLTDFDQAYSMGDIADSLSLTIRSFNRLFYKHMSMSPATFRKIARFRHSMKNKLFSDQFKTLTEIGYKSNFYDQAYFIKMYRKLTGDNPSRFFTSVEKLADDQLILKFIHQ
jgi:AraC-like DNA-binding protein